MDRCSCSETALTSSSDLNNLYSKENWPQHSKLNHTHVHVTFHTQNIYFQHKTFFVIHKEKTKKTSSLNNARFFKITLFSEFSCSQIKSLISSEEQFPKIPDLFLECSLKCRKNLIHSILEILILLNRQDLILSYFAKYMNFVKGYFNFLKLIR